MGQIEGGYKCYYYSEYTAVISLLEIVRLCQPHSQLHSRGWAGSRRIKADTIRKIGSFLLLSIPFLSSSPFPQCTLYAEEQNIY